MSTHAQSLHGQIVMSPTHCASLVARLAVQTPPDSSQILFRREAYRWVLESQAAIRYPAADGNRVTLDAKVVDLSARGIGLQCKQSLPTDLAAEVFVAAEGKTYSATVQVMYCTPKDDGFRVGCEFAVREA